MMRKGLFLFLALLLPVLIFLFLRFFGKNEFAIPVYNLDASVDAPTDCGIDYSFPYAVPNTSHIPLEGISVVFFMDGLGVNELRESNFELTRLNSELGGRGIKLIKIHSTPKDSIDSGNDILYLDPELYQAEKRCYFLSKDYRGILVDEERKIRGYYPEASLKEVDRLLLELKILLKEY